MKNSFRIIVSILLLAFAVSCGEEEPLTNSLSSYIDTSGLTLIKEDLIACAAGGQTGFLEDPNTPLSIFFYPEGDAHTFKYFETATGNVDPNDLSLYHEKQLSDLPVFNGYLRRFLREANPEPIWCMVTFIKDGSLHISNPIRLNLPNLPTEFNPSLLDVNPVEVLFPRFSWSDGIIDENEIYFHVISDDQENLITGTYTYEKQFQFYNLDNVVLNIRDISPAPTLLPNQTYTMTIMGVSIDNWVNLILEKEFRTD